MIGRSLYRRVSHIHLRKLLAEVACVGVMVYGWLKWSFNLFTCQSRPVDVMKKWMRFDFFSSGWTTPCIATTRELTRKKKEENK